LIVEIKTLDGDLAEDLFKLLKSEGVTTPHGAPLTLASFNERLEIH
jgi:hypothetical protein